MTVPISTWVFALLAVYLLVQKVSKSIHNKRQAAKHGCKPAPQELNKDPILGLDKLKNILKANKEHRFLAFSGARFAKHGYTFESFLLGRKAFHTADPKNLSVVLGSAAKDFSIGSRRIKGFYPLLGHGIFASDGKQWEKSRALVRPSFTRDHISDMEVFEKHVVNVFKHIPDGEPVDMQKLFFSMTMDSATDFLFGESVGTLSGNSTAAAAKFSQDYHEAQEGLIKRARLGPFLIFNPTFKKEFKRVVEGSRSYVQQFVEKAVRSQSNQEKLPNCFLSNLAQSSNNVVEITDQLLNILLAGRDTTAGLLGIQFFLLARRPDIYQKLREEVAQLEGKLPTFQQLRDLKYVNWTINETLRLYPIIPRNVRTAVNDQILPSGGGPDGQSPIFVPKGYNITFDTYNLHRRKDVYGPDADEFRPDRWENLRPGWAYIPFGGGPRKCIGQQFALTQAAYVTTRLVQRYERLESRDPRPFEEMITITLSSHHGTNVALFPQ